MVRCSGLSWSIVHFPNTHAFQAPGHSGSQDLAGENCPRSYPRPRSSPTLQKSIGSIRSSHRASNRVHKHHFSCSYMEERPTWEKTGNPDDWKLIIWTMVIWTTQRRLPRQSEERHLMFLFAWSFHAHEPHRHHLIRSYSQWSAGIVVCISEAKKWSQKNRWAWSSGELELEPVSLSCPFRPLSLTHSSFHNKVLRKRSSPAQTPCQWLAPRRQGSPALHWVVGENVLLC